MALVRWLFTNLNLATPVTVEFDVNPREGGSPSRKKIMTTESTLAPGGKVLIFEGAEEVGPLEWSGVILREDHLNMYLEWYALQNQILLTDDLGREQMIYITEFSPQRERSAVHPWKHTYTARASILDWP
jgi:hypothetical protein